MDEQTKDPVVTLNAAYSRFEIEAEGSLAIAEYLLGEEVITFTHTEVPPELGGRGYGSLLAKAGLAHARARQLQVIPLCTFIAGYMRKHAETHDLIHPDHRETLHA